ncbi:MAG: ribosome biogenesis GTPase Der [Oscillatoriales cyanobacterium SM2_2_1]|nr:ribosome biogenesis GTPase Der [Oscillatoriales cyanobacterium SM2_2_1]
MALPIIAIVGRPNVGKSTLVNRIAGEQYAIVFDEPGVTRDRIYRQAFWREYEFTIVDTGGLVFEDDREFLPLIRQQAMAAIREANAVIFIVDGLEGINPADVQVAQWLRQQTVPVILGVNKCESANLGISQAAEFWQLGLGEPIPFSGIHGNGTGELLDAAIAHFPPVETIDPAPDELKVAIIGRPNVGKSSLLNAFLGEERSIVSPIAGTTRDAVDTVVERDGKRYRLIDTAGVRRKKHVDYGVEFFSINRAFKAINRADVVLLVIDALDGVTDQDQKLAGRIDDEGRACVVVVNKWDAVEKDSYTIYDFTEKVKGRLMFVEYAPIIFVSALTGQRVVKILDLVDQVGEQHRRRISTAVLNEVLRDATSWLSPPAGRSGRQGKIYYGTQVSSSPPAIVLFVNDPHRFNLNYRRYIERKFRESLDFTGTPLRLIWRGKKEREAERDLQSK